MSNEFRAQRLYTEEVDIVFKRHEKLLKAIYSRYRLKPPGGGLRTKQMRLEGWNQLMQDTHFLDSNYTIQVCGGVGGSGWVCCLGEWVSDLI